MTTYRLVPVEPSEEMLNAGYTAALPIYRDEGCEPNPNDYRAIWKAMLQAAPVTQNELLEAAKEVLAAMIEDFNDPDEWPEDDGPVGGGLKDDGSPDPMAITFAHMSRLRDAIRNTEQKGPNNAR